MLPSELDLSIPIMPVPQASWPIAADLRYGKASESHGPSAVVPAPPSVRSVPDKISFDPDTVGFDGVPAAGYTSKARAALIREVLQPGITDQIRQLSRMQHTNADGMTKYVQAENLETAMAHYAAFVEAHNRLILEPGRGYNFKG